MIGSVVGAIFKHLLFIVHHTLLDNKQQQQQKNSLDFYAKKAMREVIKKKKEHTILEQIHFYEKKHVQERTLLVICYSTDW